MGKKAIWGMALAGLCAGAVNGLFGAGGGMVLVPLLAALTDLEEGAVFPASVGVILPLCIVSLVLSPMPEGLTWRTVWPYLVGSGLGGIAAGLWGRRIPAVWLHRILGALLVLGGVRKLWQTAF